MEKETTSTNAKIGDEVNIETDMIGKYVERFIRNKNDSSIDEQFLAKTGFI